MGRVIGPWGVRGWVKVAPYGDDPEGLVRQRAWWVGDREGTWTRHDVGESRVHSGTVIASLAGFETPESAAVLKGRDVAVPRSSLPKARKGEVYLSDLVGLDVVNVSGAALGKVVAVEDFGAHPVMRVAAAGGGANDGGRLVPFVPPIVLAVDLEARRIEVDWELEY
ncbi:MAG: ribosome maturation factor RimM [Betaproteobacteria bacterium]